VFLSAFQLLQPVYPGQMRYIKKNIQTMILVIDPSSPQGLSVIGNFLYMVRPYDDLALFAPPPAHELINVRSRLQLRQGLPFRVGFVFSSGSTTESASTWEHSAENLAKLAKVRPLHRHSPEVSPALSSLTSAPCCAPSGRIR
jgi:hypothetical protein